MLDMARQLLPRVCVLRKVRRLRVRCVIARSQIVDELHMLRGTRPWVVRRVVNLPPAIAYAQFSDGIGSPKMHDLSMDDLSMLTSDPRSSAWARRRPLQAMAELTVVGAQAYV